jgi:sugar-specific transcriptional regulator TrmB
MSEVTRIITNPHEARRLALKLIEEAQDEILVLFSSENSIRRQFEAKNDQYVLEAARRGVVVTVVSPMDGFVKKRAEVLEKQNENISIRSIKPLSSRPFHTIIVDNKHSLTIELVDDSKSRVEEAIGQATYSTTKRSIDDSIFRFNSVLQLFQDEGDSIKKWLDVASKMVKERKRENL